MPQNPRGVTTSLKSDVQAKSLVQHSEGRIFPER
jgi:hypothetical protein